MKKIAVVNRTNLKNYGSVLQVYALVDAVKSLGYDSCVVWESGNISRNFDFRPNKIIKTLIKLITHPKLIYGTLKTIKEVQHKEIDPQVVNRFDGFVNKNFEQNFYLPKDLKRVAQGDEYYKFICGSDQIWCSTTTYVDPLMYLRFAPKNKRIAYAPSLGRDYIPSYNRREMKRYINGIPFVSVREADGQRLIKELTGRDVPVVLDPTLLPDKSVWATLKNEACVPKEKYVLAYFLDAPSKSVNDNIIGFSKDNNLKIVNIGQLLSDLPSELICDVESCGPAEFLALVENAEAVITDSYHGMLFSMIFERRFWSVERNYQQFDQSSRQLTVLSYLGLTSRYMKNDYNFTLDEIDYDCVNEKLSLLKKQSLDFLENSIKADMQEEK